MLEHFEATLKVDTGLAVRETVASLITKFLSGDLQPKYGSGLASLLSHQLRAIETANLEQRIAKVERA